MGTARCLPLSWSVCSNFEQFQGGTARCLPLSWSVCSNFEKFQWEGNCGSPSYESENRGEYITITKLRVDRRIYITSTYSWNIFRVGVQSCSNYSHLVYNHWHWKGTLLHLFIYPTAKVVKIWLAISFQALFHKPPQFTRHPRRCGQRVPPFTRSFKPKNCPWLGERPAWHTRECSWLLKIHTLKEILSSYEHLRCWIAK